jgi:DNA-binding CsgD family transcriptional regulator
MLEVNNGRKAIHGPSQRELDVIAYAAQGDQDKEIAKKLHISPSTVTFHMKRVMAKLGARNRTHAAAIATSKGLLTH